MIFLCYLLLLDILFLLWERLGDFLGSSVKCVYIRHYCLCSSCRYASLQRIKQCFCINLSKGRVWLMLFWLWKDAWLALKRGSFEVLLRPFWTLIKALLKHGFASVWFSVGYVVIKRRHFGVLLESKFLFDCKEISGTFLLYLTGIKRAGEHLRSE